MPSGFNLAQNYPNPFNPNTIIEFQLPKSGSVNLTVYDINGRTMVRLIQGELNSGFHKVEWDGRDSNNKQVSSGIYFYLLRSGDLISKKKMILLR